MNAKRMFRFSQLLLIGMAVLLASCADKLTHEHYSQIRQDLSTKPIVVELIGEPTDKLAARWMYERPDDHLTVFIDFDDRGYVSRKQWVDAMSATWEDTKPDDTERSTRESTHIQRDTP